MNGFGGGFGQGGGVFGSRNATPEAEESLAKILRGIQLNPYGPEGNGLPTGTQTSDPLDKLYSIKQVGSKVLGYPETGVFNAPNPRSQEAIKTSLEEKRVKGLLG